MPGFAFARIRRGRKWRWFAAGALFCLVGVALIAFWFPKAFLCVEHGAGSADFIVVLGGDTNARPARAAELFRAGIAPRIIVSGQGDCEANRQVLVHAGVPSGVIIEEPESGSTRENAVFTARILRQANARRVVLVTSWYHSRRALNCFAAAAGEMEFISAPAYHGMDRAEWFRNGMASHILQEYLKTAYYLFRYGVWPI